MVLRRNSYTKNDSNGLEEVDYFPTKSETIQKFKPEEMVKNRDTLFLYITVLTGILPLLVGASSWGWASPAIIKLKSNITNENPLGRPITTMEISILIGMPTFTSLIGSFLLPKLADILGRKRSLQTMAVGMFLSIVGMAFSPQIYILIVFSSLLANFFAGVWGVLPIYVTEICEDHNRTKYGCLMSACIPLGQLYSYVFGPPFSLKVFTLITAAPLIPFFIFFCFAPDSPVYLLSKGRKDDCMKALKKLRGNKSPRDLGLDFEKIQLSLLKTVNRKNKVATLIKNRATRIGLLLAMLPILIQYFSGVPVLMVLLAPVFSEAGTSLSGNTIALIVGIVKVLAFIFTSFIIEKTGRRPMLFISSLGSGLSALMLGIYFYLKYTNSPLTQELQWLPLISVLFYIIFYSVGLGPIPQCVPSELFLSDLRSSVGSIISTYTNALYALFLFSYPLIAAAIGNHVCLWIFSVSCFIGAILFYKIMPETKGKSILEIQEVLKRY